MTVIKVADDKQPQLDTLAALLRRPDVDAQTRKKIEDEIWAVRSGIQGERDAAYEIDFEYGPRDAFMVIHDLRLEFAGRVAQIDHLLINRALDVWVCETKAFREGVKIDDFGEWYRYGGKHARGMPSPVEQNRRHVDVLRDVFDKGPVRLPRRIVTLKPTIFPVVLISNHARIDRPRTKAARAAVSGLDTVIKVEQLVRKIEQTFDERNPLGILAKVVAKETIENLARQLVALHKPAPLVGASRFGLPEQPAETPTPPAKASGARKPEAAAGRVACSACGKPVSDKVSAYAREHADQFGGVILCWDCQRAARGTRLKGAS
jgi:Nuclease-related domain.